MSLETLQPQRISGALDEMRQAVRDWATGGGGCAVVGVANGGIELARYLRAECAGEAHFGVINAAFHRDDLHIQPIPKNFTATDIDFDLDGLRVLVVDDVFASGRTVRAVMNEIFDHGRPASITLAVLVDAGRRILPIHPDICPLRLQTKTGEKVVVAFDAGKPETATVRIEAKP